MIRPILFAAALSIGGIAVAQTEQPSGQTAEEPPQPTGQTVDDPSQATGPQGVTQQGTDPQGQAVPPAGANQTVAPEPGQAVVPSPAQNTAFQPRPAAGEYPPCSRTVTDSCIQTYERGVRRARPR